TIGNPIIMNVIKKARDIACGHDGHNAPRQLPIPGVEVAPGQHIVAAIAAPIGTQEGNLDVNKPTEDVSPTGRTDSPGEQEIVDPGAAFTVWLVEGIRSGALALNTPKARVHVVSEGLLLVSPAVFRLYAGDDWRAAQKRFLKQKLSLKTAAGENFFHYRVDTNRGKKLIKGVLIPNAATKLSLDLPAANPLLSRDTETG
ncbi:MAG: DNA-binding domain-containing protein, partial [Woeseia sp.]|nr:DNA-binding domain-containing protein [Woeseia sp.]